MKDNVTEVTLMHKGINCYAKEIIERIDFSNSKIKK